MLLYGGALALTLLFAAAARYYPEVYRAKLGGSGTIVTVKLRHLLGALSFLPLFLVSALRYNVGGDYIGYERIFKNVTEGVDIYAEPGFGLLNRLVAWYSDNIQWVYALSAAITLLLLFRTVFRESASPVLSLYLFVTMGYFFSSFNILRQFIAVAIVFAAFPYLRERRFLPYLLAVAAAMTFHKTAVVMLPMYFLLPLRLKHSYMVTLGVAGLCLLPFRDRLTTLLVNTFYPQYAGTALIQPLSTFEFLYYVVVFGGLLLLATRYRERFLTDRTNLILYNALYYTFVLYLCFSFVPEINRVALYTELSVILLIPRLLQAEADGKVRRLYTGVCVVGFAGFCVVSLAVLGRWSVLPYVSIFG